MVFPGEKIPLFSQSKIWKATPHRVVLSFDSDLLTYLREYLQERNVYLLLSF